MASFISSLRVAWFLAWRYVRSRRQGFASFMAFFSWLGIALSVSTLLIVMGVMEGFHQELIKSMLGTQGHVHIRSLQHNRPSKTIIEEALHDDKDVRTWLCFGEYQALAMHNQRLLGCIIRGMPQEALRRFSLVQGEFLTHQNTKHVMLGRYALEHLDGSVGDTLTILVPQRMSIVGRLPKKTRLRVIGTFTTGVHAYDMAMIVTQRKTAESIYGRALPDIFEVRLHDPMMALRWCDKWTKKFPGTYCSDWQTTNERLLSALQTERYVMGLILGMMVVVAAFNMVAGMVLFLRDRRQDLGVLRMMGMKVYELIVTFMLMGGIVGMIGVISGIIVAYIVHCYMPTIEHAMEYLLGRPLFDPSSYMISHLPTVWVWQDVVWTSSLCAVTLCLCIALPCIRAGLRDPIWLLRHE